MSNRRENWELERRLQTACLLIITCILGAIMCYWMRTVLIPFVLSFFLFQLLDPIVRFITDRTRMPRALSVTVTLIILGGLLFYTSSVITDSVGQLIKSSDLYADRISSLLDKIWDHYPHFEARFKAITDKQLDKLGESVGSFLGALTNSVVYLISQSTVVLLFLMFLLFGKKQEDEFTGLLADIDTKIKNYILVKTGVSMVTGTLVALILHLLGVELAFVFGLLAVLLNFIPNVGSILATFLPLPVVLVDPTISTPIAVLALVLPGTMQFLIGNILEPKLLGDSLNLSPVVILFSLTVWTALWGGVGALLAVPITSIIQILCEQLDFTKPIAALLKGDLLAFLGTGRKLPPPPRQDKSIPVELEEAGIDRLAHDIKTVEKKFKEPASE